MKKRITSLFIFSKKENQNYGTRKKREVGKKKEENKMAEKIIVGRTYGPRLACESELATLYLQAKETPNILTIFAQANYKSKMVFQYQI